MANRGLLDPRLSESLIRLKQGFDVPLTDWRCLEPSDIIRHTQSLDPGARSLLATAIFAGTTQACMQGSYWAPSFGCPGAAEVSCAHLARPISCHYPVGKRPNLQGLPQNKEGQTISAPAEQNALDACARLSHMPPTHRVVLMRFTAFRDTRSRSIRYGHCSEDQIFLRTTYPQAFERMEGDICANVEDCLDKGGIIYTSGVGLLRGPIVEGALWFREPPKIDVLWVALPGHVALGEEDEYANEKDRNDMAGLLDRAFACAAGHGATAVVLPPVGVGVLGCNHPGLDVADLIHKTAQKYSGYFAHVCIASDIQKQRSVEGWADFAKACQQGRPPFQRIPKVPPIALPPHRKKHGEKELAEKALCLARKKTPRSGRRNTFL
mmetsp:Transcript_41379/g.88160  ORF Transcript_41379/g.88160 Transcript_41379/m.88160 type:complete len:380 (+) Transcript_41379:99-1238(+)